jgi:20S proteasome subunit beta 4
MMIKRLLLLFIVLSCQPPQHFWTNASQAAGTETLVAVVGKDFVLVGADSSVSQSISLTASNLDKIAVVSEPFKYGDERQQQLPHGSGGTILAAAAGDAADADRLISMLQAQALIQEYQFSVGVDVDYYDVVKQKQGQDGEEDVMTAAPVGDSSYYSSGSSLTVDSVAHLCRGQIARSLRSKAPIQVCLLIAGLQPDNGDSSVVMGRGYFAAEQVQRQVQEAYATHRGESSSSIRLVQEAAQAAAKAAAQATSTSTTTTTTTLIPRLYWLDEYGSLQNIQYGAHGHGANFILSILDQGYRPNLTLEEATKLLRDCFQQLRTRYVINSPQPPCIKCVDAKGCRLIR